MTRLPKWSMENAAAPVPEVVDVAAVDRQRHPVDVVALGGQQLGDVLHHERRVRVQQLSGDRLADQRDPQSTPTRSLHQAQGRHAVGGGVTLGVGEEVRRVADGPGDHPVGDQVDGHARRLGRLGHPVTGRL